jgi:hypothetical protein
LFSPKFLIVRIKLLLMLCRKNVNTGGPKHTPQVS